MADEITSVSISTEEFKEAIAEANKFLRVILSDPDPSRFYPPLPPNLSSITSNLPASEVQYQYQHLQPISDSKFQAINLLSQLEADNSLLLTRIASLESSLQSLLSSTSDECYQPGGEKDTARDAAKECLNDLTLGEPLSRSEAAKLSQYLYDWSVDNKIVRDREE